MLDKLKLEPINNWLKKNNWHFYNHQLETVTKTLQGYDVLLVAPTGGGKTLAGFLPALEDLINNQYPKNQLHTLYISPLKALTVDVHRNLLAPIQDQKLDIKVETRTGDTSSYKKARQKQAPPHMLMTTPESLALLLASPEANDYFKFLKFLIIDEIHSLVNSKRGDLLSLNLSRLETIAPKCKKLGLSATVKNKNSVLAFLSQKNKSITINVQERSSPSIDILKTDIRVPWSGHMASYAIKDIYKKIINSTMSIVFVNTRAQAELVFNKLWHENEKNLKIAIHHGSLEKEMRRKVENMMSRGLLDCVVATSSLDLGIDWGNIDLVIQIGSPKGIARFLQRIGRSNHRLNEPSRALLVPSNRFEYLECVSAISSIRENILDEINDKEGSLDVLAQHILGVACSKPFEVNELFTEIKNSWPYRNLQIKKFIEVLEFVKNGGYSLKNYDQYSKIGLNKENLYTIKNKNIRNKYRLNVGTIVESYMLKVKLGNRTLGQVEEWFIEGLNEGDTFLFGGRILEYQYLSNNNVIVRTTKHQQPKIPSYAGGRLPLSSELSFQVRSLISKEENWKNLPSQISEWLRLQLKFSNIPGPEELLVETFPRNIKNKKRYFLICYSFEGRNANQTLGFLISKRMQRMGYKPIGFVATEYALAIWSMNMVEDINILLSDDIMLDDLYEWLEETPLLKKNFRDAAIISGLIERIIPGQKKTGKQIMFNSDLIFDVLKKHEPNHLLLQVARQDSYRGLIDLDRLSKFLKRINKNIILKKLNQISPLAIPLILEINRQTIDKSEVNEYFLQELEEQMTKEVGLN
ncbi:ligase-associated DNA damage response DEXH box helicase [Alphaproteobacteria bacterium]|nr:ligase-associated DNA damage response DEXH box helicase [Alphaproteobacteria bacterium]